MHAHYALRWVNFARARTRNALVSPDGTLNPDGKTKVEAALRVLYVNGRETLSSLPDDIKTKMDMALPHMLRAETEGGVWSVLPAVREANDLIMAYKASGHKEPSTFLRQVNMQSGKAPIQTASPLAVGIFNHALGDKKRSDFVDRFRTFAAWSEHKIDVGRKYYPQVVKEEFGVQTPSDHTNAVQENTIESNPLSSKIVIGGVHSFSGTPAQEQNLTGRSDTLSDHFARQLESGKKYDNIGQARREGAEITGDKIATGTVSAKKFDEAVELGVVKAARSIVEKMNSENAEPVDIFRALVDLYKRQPNLAVRTSTSISEQAYSTPVPLAYLASHIAGTTSEATVFEPTAGNGALLIEASPKMAVVNELNPDRASALRSQGFYVTEKDAATYTPAKKVDIVLANPPFGRVRNDDGETKSWRVAGYETKELDHAIVLRALESLKEDGRAVLIIGGKEGSDETRSEKYHAAMQRQFYGALFDNYKVLEHFTVDGKMYSRQGAGYNIDFIVIGGRGKTEGRAFPAANLPKIYDSFEALEGLIHGRQQPLQKNMDAARDGGVLPAGTRRHTGAEERIGSVPASVSVGVVSDTDNRARSGRGDGGAVAQGGTMQPDAGRGETGGRGRGSDELDVRAGEHTTGMRRQIHGTLDIRPESGGRGLSQQDSGRREGDQGNAGERGHEPVRGRSEDTVHRKLVAQQQKETEHQVPYTPSSSAGSMGTLVPRNIATPLKAALGQIEKKHGDIDDYVAGELGYSQKDLHKYFAGEQIDAIALAIDNIANGNGFIIGDQTGIGKGRVNAAIIRYANKKGMTPVFVTMKPDLYADMIRDLHDIGETNFRPLPTNSGLSSEKAIPLPNGKELRTGESKKHMALMRNAADTGFKDHDAVFTTYDQLSSTGSEPRRELLMQIAPNALFILDESHNAGADSGARNKKDAKVGRATFIRGMLARSQNGVFYSSATYAKRPDVMSLYFKTDMRHAVEDIGKLADAISAGGIPLQQVVAAQLTESGQYIRRERSFEGASVDIAPAKVDMQNAEQSATIMRAIRDFNAIKETAIKEAEKKAKAKGESVTDNKATGDKGASSVNFTSVMHNLIGQSLLAIKSVAAADEAAAAVERGEKPVITLANTMGSFIKEEVDRDAVVPGGRLKTTFKDLYKRYLEKTRTLTRKDRGGKTIESRLLTDEEIGPAGVAAYNAALRVIDKSAFANLPISPIDAITQELERRGISVGEITGRNDAVEYREDEPHYRTRKTSPAKNIDTVRKFNNGQLDAIILNQSGSTGISLHSSSTFTDQRKRTMIIVQPELNIDVFMQTLGRVFRTGQVVPPSYKLLTSDMPAEKRPAAVLGKKMAGLNANTTASRKSDTSFQNIPDFLNEYGDAVAAQIMEEETELHAALGSPLKGADGASLSREDAVKKVTGRIPMLPIKEQQALYERIEKEYSELIEQIESTGGSTLEARTLPLDAKLVSEETLTPAKDVGSTSPFASESKLGLFDVKVLGKPYTPEQVQEMVKKGNETTPHPIDIERSATEWMDEKTSGIDDAEAKQRFRVKMTDNKTIVKYIFTGFPVGKTVIVSTNDSTFYGIVTRSEFNGKEGSNPVAPSSWRMTVAVADPAKQITLPFSKISTDPSADIKFGGAFVSDSRISIKDIMNMFLSGQTSRREQRYIAHGNILAAFASVNGKGQIVNFEDSDGAIRPGILFKKDTSKGEIIGNAGVSFPDFSYMAGFFDATNGKGIIKTADGNLTLLRLADGSMKINSEASKAKGAQFFLNGKLLNAAGKDFVKSGNSMTMTVPATTAERMVGVLREQGYGFIADNHIEEARTVMGLDKKDNAPRASITPGQFLPPPAPVTRSPGGTKENAVLRVVEDMQAKAANAAPMEIVQDFEDLPAYLKSYFEGDAKSVDNLEGLYDPLSGKVFLIASNLESPQRAAEVWLHEQVVHHGLRSLLPDGDRQRLLNNLWASSGGMNNAEIADIARHYGLDPRGNPEDRHIVMEEYLASLAEKNKAGLLTSPQEKSLWRRFVEAISRAWRSMLQAAGVSDGLMASKEMDALLTELGEHVMGGLPQTGGARGMREASASRGTSPPQRPPAPLASWTSSPMGKLTGAEKAMRMVENEDIGSFFPDKTDLTTMKRIVMLPHWIAKKFPQFGTIYRRQLRRMDERNADKMQSLQEVPSLFGDKGELVRGKDMDDLRTLIWNNDGQAIPDLVNTPKFVPDGKFENGRAILKKNSAWDREYEKWLAKQPGSDAAKKAMLEVRQSLDNDLMRAHNRMAEMSEMSDGDIANFRQTINHQHNYFPHHRYGKYYVQAKVGDEVVFRKHFDATGRELAKKKAAEIIAEQRKNFPGAAWRADENSKLPEEVYGAPLDTEAMEQVIKAATSKLEDKGQAESVRSALSEAIADTLKARGWGSHAIGRKGIPGHEDQDILRVLHDYKAGLSGWLTKMEAAKDFAKALGKIDARNHPVEWGYASQYVKDMLRNTEKIDRVAGNIKSVAFAWYLGANLKTAALNLTQNIISGVPRLHMDITGGAGYFQAAMDAIVHNVTGKSDGMNADEKKLLQELYDNAVITEGYMEEVRGRVSGVDGAALWNRLLKSMGWFMAVAERFNRASLALAAYRAARGGNLKKNVRTEYGITGEKADHEQAKAYAENIVRDAHFVYGKANTPEALRSSAAGRAVSPAYTFRTFSHNLLSLWSWALRTQGVEGAKMVSKGLGATLLIGGVASAPFFGTAMALFQAATGSDDDWMEELRKLATKYLGAGDMGRDIISYGIPSVVGVNLGGSLKMETPFSHSMKKGGTLKEVLTDSIGDIIGIPYDMFVQRPSKVADAYRNLNAYRMAEEAMPTAVQNAMRAWRLHTDGQTSMSGRSINDPGSKGARKLTGTEALGKLLGFQPVSSTKSYDRYSANKHSDNVRSDKAGEFAARTLKLREEGKSVSAVREDMKAWNDEMKKAEKPWMVIKQEDVDRRVVARRRDGKLSDRERPRAAAQAVVW